MTKTQLKLRELRERQSKERGRMAELAIADNLTDETRAELDTIETGTPDLERQIRAATSAVETEESEQRAAHPGDLAADQDGEDRERAELRKTVRMSNYIVAAVEQRAAVGPEEEYNAAIGISGNRFPMEMLAPPEARAERTEDRATTDADTMTTPRRWIDRLFAETAAVALGITMESVFRWAPPATQSPPPALPRRSGSARQTRPPMLHGRLAVKGTEAKDGTPSGCFSRLRTRPEFLAWSRR